MGWNFGLNWTPSIEKGPWFDGRTNLQFAIYRTGHLHKSSERQEPKRWSKSSKDHAPCNSQRWGISRMLIWVQHPIVLLKSKLYSILSALAWPGPLPTIKLTLRVWCHGPFIKVSRPIHSLLSSHSIPMDSEKHLKHKQPHHLQSQHPVIQLNYGQERRNLPIPPQSGMWSSQAIPSLRLSQVPSVEVTTITPCSPFQTWCPSCHPTL